MGYARIRTNQSTFSPPRRPTPGICSTSSSQWSTSSKSRTWHKVGSRAEATKPYELYVPVFEGLAQSTREDATCQRPRQTADLPTRLNRMRTGSLDRHWVGLP